MLSYRVNTSSPAQMTPLCVDGAQQVALTVETIETTSDFRTLWIREKTKNLDSKKGRFSTKAFDNLTENISQIVKKHHFVYNESDEQ